ncbi:MAG: putative lipid II flippase FtsW [Chloroflexota bacterium]|nr:putative lipid II flippase FtsW [Chloroflexota bacterium]
MVDSAARTRLAKAGPMDGWVLAPVVALLMLGVVMIYSVTSAEAFLAHDSASHFLVRHVQWLLLGCIALVICSRVDYHRWRRLSVPVMILAVTVLAVVVFAPHSVSPEINGARRWIRIGSLQGQPSEFAKLAFVIYAADWLSQKGEKVRNLWYGLIPFGIILGLLIGLIMLEPDMGTSLVFVATGGTMFFVAGAHLLQLAGAALLATGAFTALIFSASYRLDRLTTFLDPWSDPLTNGYQPIQSLLALGSGGLGGRGLGVSRQKFGWLPEARTDGIMAIVGEELGFFGGAVVLGLVVVLAVRGFSIALRCRDPFGALLASGVTAWIVFQALLNIAVISLTVPFTGIPMPFISLGGSSLVVLLAAVGILLNVSRYAEAPQARESRRSARGRTRRLQTAEGRS